MIRRLGKTAGLIFTDQVADRIADTCADMPFWIRKSCSYIHNRIEIGVRPFEPQQDAVSAYLKEFLTSDGAAMSEVALAHLFRVYPELRDPALKCAKGDAAGLDARTVRALQKYGIIRHDNKFAINGQMIVTGLQTFMADLEADGGSNKDAGADLYNPHYGDWAEEIALISKRRNLIERKLRSIVLNFIRYSSLSSPNSGLARDRILRSVKSKRRDDLQRIDLDEVMNKLYWLEVASITKKEWPLFEKIFGDRSEFDRFSSIVNERPDAHAKDLDVFDIASHRKALTWFEERLSRA